MKATQMADRPQSGAHRWITTVVMVAMLAMNFAGFGAQPASAAPQPPAPTFVDYAQCANGKAPSVATNCSDGWINGILNPNNSHYAEDQVTPQRAEVIVPAGTGLAHTLTFRYQARKGGIHAYDSLATWNYTQTTADPCQGLATGDCVGGIASTFPIPSDPTVVADLLGSGTATSGHQLLGQVMTMYGGSITGISVPTHDDPSSQTTDDYATQIVSFTIASALTDTKVQLLFGGHTAASVGPRGWGTGVGSSSVSGGPYHIKWDAADGQSIGQRDNQIQGGNLIVQPTLVTTASGTVVVGSTISDSATLSGGNNPTGSITFNLYGPNDAICATSIFNSSATVNGNGSYGSGNFTTTAVGTYRWIANYSGDTNNLATANGCNEANESVVVTKASPSILTTPSAGGIVGIALTDTAALSGGFAPLTGTVTFNLYAPGDLTCTTSIGSSVGTVSGGSASSGTATTGSYTTSAVGTYHWTAVYSGDANNNGATSGCSAEPVTTTKASPTVTTNASYTSGGAIHDSATLSGGYSPTGTITFDLYGPNDATCATSIFNSSATVSGAGTYQSGNFTPTAVGTYRWIANYSGDANNNATANACNGANESVDVSKVTVLKTQNGAVPTLAYTFVLSGGPDSVNISRTTDVNNQGALDFGFLKPGANYQLCELAVPAGTHSTLQDQGGVVDSNTGNICLTFTLNAGVTTAFTIDNSFPGGGQRTIGYWKNWNSCSHDGAFVDRAAKTGNHLADEFLPQTVGDLVVDSCETAISILSKTPIGEAKNAANDPAFNLAAQLLAAELNVAAGAGTCGAATTAIAQANALLSAINFDGATHDTMSKAQKAQALTLAGILDQYNNGKLC